jgi:LysM repeat protein
MKYPGLILIITMLYSCVVAQPPRRITHAEYIQMYKDDAIRDMKKMGVPASITLAQGILESDCGNSDLAREAKNHFGIKCHKEWTGETYIKDDDTKDECFRKYRTVLESFDDHGRFLRERPRYAFLFDYEITDYKSWAHGLKKAGYATNPRYGDILIKIIEDHNLSQYDRGGHAQPIIAKGNDDSTPKAENKPVITTTAPATQANKNAVPYVIAKQGDTWLSVAMAHEMRLWQLYKYNDAGESDELQAGEIVYLKPKRGRPAEQYHVISKGETLRLISQNHGVRLKKLIKLNEIDDPEEVKPGQKIRLR